MSGAVMGYAAAHRAEAEIELGQTGSDADFMAQVRMLESMRRGVSINGRQPNSRKIQRCARRIWGDSDCGAVRAARVFSGKVGGGFSVRKCDKARN
jgi:hypothetical protein